MLRTLKDLEKDEENGFMDTTTAAVLRREAEKWIEHYEELTNNQQMTISNFRCMKNWIQDFFNIREICEEYSQQIYSYK